MINKFVSGRCEAGGRRLPPGKVFSAAILAIGAFCSVAFTASGQGEPIPPPPGLVAWWPGDGNANDVVGSNNGLLNGATFTGGVVSRAFYLDGSGAQVLATTFGLPTGSDDRTIEFWVRAETFLPSPNYAFFAGYGAFGDDESTFEAGALSDGTLWWSQWGSAVLGAQLPAGQWNHVAVTSQDSTANLYVNGCPVGSGALPFSTPANTLFYMGAIGVWGGVHQRLQGALDEISVYNRALSIDDLQAIYQAGSAGKIKPGAPLHIGSAGPSVLVWWPTNASGFVLETSVSLGPSQSWSIFSGPIDVIGDQNLAAVDAASGSKFFRLRSQ